MTLSNILCEMLTWWMVAVVTVPPIAIFAYNLIDSLLWKRRLAKEEQENMKALLAFYERGMTHGH